MQAPNRRYTRPFQNARPVQACSSPPSTAVCSFHLQMPLHVTQALPPKFKPLSWVDCFALLRCDQTMDCRLLAIGYWLLAAARPLFPSASPPNAVQCRSGRNPYNVSRSLLAGLIQLARCNQIPQRLLACLHNPGIREYTTQALMRPVDITVHHKPCTASLHVPPCCRKIRLRIEHRSLAVLLAFLLALLF